MPPVEWWKQRMSHFRLSNPRVLAAGLLESAMIFAVLWMLGGLTLRINAEVGDGFSIGEVALYLAVLFAVGLFGARRAWMRDATGLRREFVLVFVICILFGAVFVFLWTAYDGDWTHERF